MSTPEKPTPPQIEKAAQPENLPPAVSDVAEQTREAVQNIHGAKLFASEDNARQFLKDHIPPKENDRQVDLAPLKEQLFEIPENLAPGHYEFEGKNGFRVSFDLVSADSDFDRCGLLYKDAEGIEGDYRPIFVIKNLQIRTNNFSYDEKELSRPVGITWLPKLRSAKTELTSVVAYRGNQRDVHLMGEDGWHARPINLLGLFHELGHSETRSPEDQRKEENSVSTIITGKGVKTEPFKKAALELQRELDANSWMLQRAGKLFDDLGISRELIEDYIEHKQMRSYYEANRRRLAQSTE
mgnify:CR=1 FL=1